jgi:hypothetical protein
MDARGFAMRTKFAIVAIGAALLGGPAAPAHESVTGSGGETQVTGGNAGSAVGMEVVGHNPIGWRGYNADVWVHERRAYVGSWGFSDWNTGGEQRFCPAEDISGVVVLDARDPARPREVSRLRHPRGTSAEDVVVFTARYGKSAGRDIAVSGIQVCGGSRYDTSLFRGLQVWDVTEPARPVELARLSTGCCTRGLHELEVQHRPDLRKTFVYASVPTSEYADSNSPSGRRDQAGRGDFRLIDVTNPRAPVEVSSWGVHRNLVAPPAPGLGCDADNEYGHGAEPSADGRTVFVSYWDSGFIALDVTDPSLPVYRGTTQYPLDADGDAHSSNYDERTRILYSADEDFCKTSGAGTEKGFGYLRVWDYSSLSAPRQIGTYKTPNTAGADDQQAGDYTIHNPLLIGDETLLASWYTDGIRVIDISRPAAPTEVAHFVPPSENNPVKPSQRGVLTNTTQVWGVAYDETSGLVYASDMNSGLWVLRRTSG